MKIIKILAVNIFVLLFLLLFAEIGTRIFFRNHNNYKRTFPGEFENRSFSKSQIKVIWPRISKKFGWVCNNSEIRFTNPHYLRQKIKYSINSAGFRYHINKLIDTTKKIMILGDSFVFGVYLNDTATIPYYLEKLTRQKNYNFGIPGWGIDQMYLSFLAYNKEIKPQTIILFYIDDDITRVNEAFRFTEGMNKPCFTLAGDSLVFRKNDKSFFEQIIQKSWLLNPLYKWYWNREAIKLSKKIFIEIKQKKGSSKFLIVHIPLKEQVLNPKNFKSYIRKEFYLNQHIDFVDIQEYFSQFDSNTINKLYLEHDGHLSSKGTKLIAQIIKQMYLK